MNPRSLRRPIGGMLTLAVAVLATVSSATSAASAPSTSPMAELASTLAPIHGTYSPTIDPANFVTTIDNQYWPLTPGTTYHYEGVRGKTLQTDDEVVTSKTKQ